MPIPLFWLALGATAIGAYTQLNTDKRMKSASKLELHTLPEGAILCCGIYGAFRHTGIWTRSGIVELKGNGLVRQVSPERFLSQRSGENIYVACGGNGEVLSRQSTASCALEQLFQYKEYHLRSNNCYRFVWQCISGQSQPVDSFAAFEHLLNGYFQAQIQWLRWS